MNAQFDFHQNGIYFLNPHLTHQQITSAIKRCLCQADALINLLTLTDFDALDSETLSDYLWALSDLIHEGKLLQGMITQND